MHLCTYGYHVGCLYLQHEDPDVQAGTEEVGVSGVDEGGFRFHLAFIASDGCTACSPAQLSRDPLIYRTGYQSQVPFVG
jgi:hypothetical protein